MQEAWLQLECPDCNDHREATVHDLSTPETEYACPSCGSRRPLREFMATTRDLEVLQQFYQ